jgi:hypothetical protein
LIESLRHRTVIVEPVRKEPWSMPTPVTAAMLYDLVACPHRVTMDLYGDPADRDEPNAFVKLLWEKGSLYEREVIAGLELPFLDLTGYAGDETSPWTFRVSAG